MEEMKQHLAKEKERALMRAERNDTQVVEAQAGIAALRAEAGQMRAYAAECDRLLALYPPRAGMSEEQSAAFDAEGLTGTWREPSSEGVGGRTVVHVDAPEEQGDAGLPDAVWIDRRDIQDHQAGFVSDSTNTKFLLQVDILTAEQKAKYGVQS